MNSNRTGCAFVLFAGVMVGMLTHMARAWDPDLQVTLDGPETEWVPAGTRLTFDATATGGTVGSWRYYVYPGGDIAECDCDSCGDPPATQYTFSSVGAYNLCVDVEENDESCNTLDSAWDSKTVYTYVLQLSCAGYIPVNDDDDDSKLRPLTAVLTSHGDGGDARLSYSGSASINVYREVGGDPKGQLLTLPWSWPRSHGPVPSLYVEGVSTSSAANDSHLTLSYVRSGITRASTTVSFTVVNLQITSPTGPDRDVAFNSAKPGVCGVNATGTTGVTGLNAQLEWTLQSINDPCTVTSPTIAYGASGAFTYSGLPRSNNGFGPKTLTLTLRDAQQAIVSQATATIRVFFTPDANNHPGGYSPNWFCYWKDGRAVPDLADSDFGFDPNLEYGLYDAWPPTGQSGLWVGPLAGGSQSVNYVFRNHFVSTRLLTGRNGINDTRQFSTQYAIDDINNIDYGKGDANAVAIIPGSDGILQTQAVPDDERVEVGGVWVITTGADGRLNTLKHQNDDYQTYLYNGVMVPIDPLPDANGVGGGGKPGTIAVTPGTDGWLDLDLYIRVDDEIDMSTLDFNDPDLNYDYIGSWHGIDLCAVTCSHELVHKDNYDDGGGGSLDDDDDGVISTNEGSENYYLNYCITDTYDVAGTLARSYYGEYGDNEFLCRIREMNYVDPNNMGGSTDPDKDWSKDGKRWHAY